MLQIDFKDGIIKAAPIVGAAAADGVTRIYGLTLSDWFYVAVTIYTMAQTVAVIIKALRGDKDD